MHTKKLTKHQLQQRLYKVASNIRMGSIALFSGFLLNGWFHNHIDAKAAGIGGLVVFVVAGVCDFLEG